MARKNDQLLPLVESFFHDHLSHACGASAHTIRAYRDALKLFFCFLAERKKAAVSDLSLEDLQVDSVSAFLNYLEEKRSNSTASRNYRLAAIKSFVKHLLRHDLAHANQYQRILALPSKKTHIPIAHYLEPEDVRLILKQPDRRTVQGQRDYALLLFLYNTDARITEALTVCTRDLSLIHPRHVILHGKGDKDRYCPLWRDTTKALKQLPVLQSPQPDGAIFCNRFGEPLSRDGAAYILRKYATLAGEKSPSLRRKKISPHILRHSCAVALLQAGVDITVIRDYLGHASIITTSRYITTNLKMKRDALENFWHESGLSPAKTPSWKPKPDLLRFLASL